jgi:hypothetical protein
MNILIRIWIQQSHEDPGHAFLNIFYALFCCLFLGVRLYFCEYLYDTGYW